MKIVPFVIPGKTVELAEKDGTVTLYRVVRKLSFSTVLEKIASYPALAA